MWRHHRLALAACLAAACLLFLPAAPAACAQGVEEAEPYEKSSVIENRDTLKGKIPRR